MKRISVFVVMLILLLSGCGGGGSDSGGEEKSKNESEDQVLDASGSWAGTWYSLNAINGGELSFELEQDGDDLTGTANFTGSPCFAGGSFAGKIDGEKITGTMTAGGIVVKVAMTITGNDVNGSYLVESGGACTNDGGTITASR
ncbi:MAG: hypothetical protein ABFD81_18065 [Syntrophaceae bacterium]